MWKSVVDGQKCTIEATGARAGDLSNPSSKITLLVRGIHGVIVTYDFTSMESFASVEDQV